MKHTHSRKKMLLSSVAMLLVALVALGSATYAWFTANPNANASGIKLKTTAAAGLVVRTDSDETWSHAAELYKGVGDVFNLNPVSQDQSSPASFWKVDAAESGKYDAKEEEMTPASGGTYDHPNTGDFYSEKVYFRLSDGSNATENASKKVYLKGVTINKADSATMENTIRVAVADKSGKLIGTYALSTAGQHGTLTGTERSAAAFNPAIKDTAASINEDVNVGSLTADAGDTNNFVTVYVYLDGQDTECYSDKVGTVNAAKIIESIQLNFTLAD